MPIIRSFLPLTLLKKVAGAPKEVALARAVEVEDFSSSQQTHCINVYIIGHGPLRGYEVRKARRFGRVGQLLGETRS